MKKNKLILASVAALMAVSQVLSFGSQVHTVQAADNSVRKTVMYNSIAYDKDEGKIVIPRQSLNSIRDCFLEAINAIRDTYENGEGFCF